MAKAAKSLKEEYRAQIWIILLSNTAALFVATHYELYSAKGAIGLLPAASRLIPVGLGLAIATVANGILSSEFKARLVFLRWNNALPGHRAFSEYGPADPRIDMGTITKLLKGTLPGTPAEQNQAWYKMLKEVENDASVRQAHRDFLFTRDYAALSALFILLFGAVAAFTVGAGRPFTIYMLFLVLQFAVVRHVAATYGKGFVTTVLARRATKQK